MNTERKFLFGIYQIGRDQSFLLQRLVIRPSPLEDFCFVSVSPAMSAATRNLASRKKRTTQRRKERREQEVRESDVPDDGAVAAEAASSDEVASPDGQEASPPPALSANAPVFGQAALGGAASSAQLEALQKQVELMMETVLQQQAQATGSLRARHLPGARRVQPPGGADADAVLQPDPPSGSDSDSDDPDQQQDYLATELGVPADERWSGSLPDPLGALSDLSLSPEEQRSRNGRELVLLANLVRLLDLDQLAAVRELAARRFLGLSCVLRDSWSFEPVDVLIAPFLAKGRAILPFKALHALRRRTLLHTQLQATKKAVPARKKTDKAPGDKVQGGGRPKEAGKRQSA